MRKRKNRGGYESAREPKPWPKVSPGPADGQEVISVPQPKSGAPFPPPEPPSARRCANCGKCPECGR